MNEVNYSAKKTFSKIGLIYAIYSIAAMIAQIVAIQAATSYFHPSMFVSLTDIQMTASTVSLHVTGLILLTVGLGGFRLPVVKLYKHGMSIGAFLKAVCMCYALLIVSNLIGTWLTDAIGILQGKSIANPVEQVVLDMSLPVMCVVTVVAAPIFEELFFRKFLIDRTVQYGELLSAVLSGFMFGLFHGNLSQFPYAFALGVFFAFVYIRTGHIGYSIALHAAINFLGSIAGSILLKDIDLEYYTIVMSNIHFENLMELIKSPALKGVLLLAGYEAAAMLLVAVGGIFWILEGRKIIFQKGSQTLAKGSRFKTVILNFGMLSYIIIWVLMIIFATV